MGLGEGTELADDQISRVALKLDLDYVNKVDDLLVFNSADSRGALRGEVAIPVKVVAYMVTALDRGADRTHRYEGWIDPSKGFVEFEVRAHSFMPIRRLEKFSFETRPCLHVHSSSPPTEFIGNMVYPLIRVTSPDGNTCIEISRNSMLCPPRLPVDLGERGSRTHTTLKIFTGGSLGVVDLERKAVDLANSMLFELNARHRAAYSLRTRAEGPDRQHLKPEISYEVRFPKTPVPDSVAALFAIPSDFTLRRHRTLAFLSYYQILEYYLPVAHKREAVRRVRRVLRSLDFDTEKDSSVLKILNSVERSHGASEGEQLRALVEDSVPEDKLRAFFEGLDERHFGKRGPISGVGAIHLNSGESIGSQVAKRVYALRNRIVHAKDDPRYAGAAVLLPGSSEEAHLLPDIELMRLLAVEVVVDNR
ncbi:hypothetical protein [Streptomyces sp. NPDC051577]|uniref:hypothetical protein n=1 Tax=Streptomyces sp. NPDC051577 TaxID=3155166 RepID=UPI00343DFA71